jgi:hypothetical protein
VSWEGLHKRASSGVPTGKDLFELDPVTKEAMQLALKGGLPSWICCIQPLLNIFPIVHWSTHAETTTSATQVEAHPLVEQFPDIRDIVKQSACQVAEGAHNNALDNTLPSADTETHVRRLHGNYPIYKGNCCGR